MAPGDRFKQEEIMKSPKFLGDNLLIYIEILGVSLWAKMLQCKMQLQQVGPFQRFSRSMIFHRLWTAHFLAGAIGNDQKTAGKALAIHLQR